MEKLLTIIVPIYNVEKYLNDCLDSFVSQTNKDFLVLLIDDGSTDSSGEIAKEYATKNPDLFIYHKQENKGLGGARNTGLSFCNSKYVMFFDSDDFMANRAVEHILEHIEKHETDIIFFNPVIYDQTLNTFNEWHDAKLMRNIFAKSKVINPKQCGKLMLTEASVCRAVWKKEFLDRINLKFLEHIHWEDVPPHFLLMHNALSASFLDYEGAYYYRTNTGNQITAGSGKSRLEMKTIFEQVEPCFKDKSWTKKEKTNAVGFLSNYILWSIRVIDEEYLSEFVDICHAFLKRIKYPFLSFYFTCKVSIKNKIMVYLLKRKRHLKIIKNRDKMLSRVNFLKKIKRILKR